MLRRFNLRHEKLSELGECRNQGSCRLLGEMSGKGQGFATGARLFRRSELKDDLF